MNRNSYGEINRPNVYLNENKFDLDLYSEARCLIASAEKKKKIPAAYDTISFDKKRRADGSALHHEIYDISDDARHVLVCVRETEGTRYGVKTLSKTYFIVSAHGKTGVKVQEAPKAKAAKAAKQAGNNYGFALEVCMGKEKLKTKATEKRTGFKIVADTESGFKSVYDGSDWTPGKTRRERATMNHAGGFYIFPTLESAVKAWENRVAFNAEWMTEEKYAILECECAGNAYQHDNQKICVTRCKPIAPIANFIG